MAELGFYARELNAGWKEWKEFPAFRDTPNPIHSERVAAGGVRCSCSFA